MKAEDSEAAAQPQADSVPEPLLVAAGIEKAFERTRALAGADKMTGNDFGERRLSGSIRSQQTHHLAGINI